MITPDGALPDMDNVKVGQIFTPGKLPRFTYVDRKELSLETKIEDYIDETGSILLVGGPTKTGKTVLIRRIIDNPIWIDGQGIEGVENLWRRIGDKISVYTHHEHESIWNTTETKRLDGSVSAGGWLGGSRGVASESSTGLNGRSSVVRPIEEAATMALRESSRALVIDDFHFIDRGTQREIVRALKPLVFDGRPIIFISTSHRVKDVILAESEMGGRVTPVTLEFWPEEDLVEIARLGFRYMNLQDPDDNSAKVLAKNSFGSPFLMQRLCREFCKYHGYREPQGATTKVGGVADWGAFFRGNLEMSAEDWFKRFLRGPEVRGKSRNVWQDEWGNELDVYGIALAVMIDSGPRLELDQREIKSISGRVIKNDGPANHQVTRALKRIGAIAGTRKDVGELGEEYLDAMSESDADSRIRPVLEYIEDESSDELHIIDPFFAFYLRWGADSILRPRRD